MELPKTKTKIQNDLSSQHLMIYGEPKVGKTTFASNFPNSLFLSTEKGYNHLEILNVDINKWTDMYDLAKLLKDNNSKEPWKSLKHLVVDVVDDLYRLCEEHICNQHGVQSINEGTLAYGMGMSLTRKEFEKIIKMFERGGYRFVFISHAMERTRKTSIKEWTQMATSLSQKTEVVITKMCDLILYCYAKHDGTRLIRTKGTEYVIAGDRTGRLPEIIPMDFEEFNKLLKGEKK